MKRSTAQNQQFLGTGATGVRQEKETSLTLQEMSLREVFDCITNVGYLTEVLNELKENRYIDCSINPLRCLLRVHPRV